MRKLATAIAVVAAMLIAPLAALAQEGEWRDTPAPQEPQPQAAPPPPPAETPPPPQQPEADAQPEQAAPATAPPGQWVWTQQYGWVWMPYSDSYTQVPSSGYGSPYVYVYYPAYTCWTWVAAPWIWGIGPWPWFGVWGPARFAWYGHGWWRYPGNWHYHAPAYAVGAVRPWNGGRVPASAPAYRPGATRGTFAPPPRASSVAPAPRGAPAAGSTRAFTPPGGHAFVGGTGRGGFAPSGGSFAPRGGFAPSGGSFAPRGGGRSGGWSGGGRGGGHGGRG